MTKAIGIATKQRAAAVCTFYSGDAGKECATNTVKNHFQERKYKELPIGIARNLYALIGFIRLRRSVVLLRFVLLFLFLLSLRASALLGRKKRVVEIYNDFHDFKFQLLFHLNTCTIQ